MMQQVSVHYKNLDNSKSLNSKPDFQPHALSTNKILLHWKLKLTLWGELEHTQNKNVLKDLKIHLLIKVIQNYLT